MTSFHEIIKRLSESVSEGDLPAASHFALTAVCDCGGAQSGILLYLDQRPSLQYGDTGSADQELPIETFLHSPETMWRHDQDVLLKLTLGTEVFAVLLLKQCKNAETLEPALQAFSSFITLIEQNQNRMRLLELSQEGLRNLSRESAEIAQSNARLFKEMTSNENRLRSISRGVLTMQEEERSKISRELHDGIGQALTALKMNIELLSGELSDLPAQSRERLHDVKTLAEQSLEDVRELSRLLRPRILDDLGLFPTLRWYARRFGERTGIEVTLKIPDSDKRFDPEIETMLFRITQEALNNAAKHSQSPTVSIRLESHPDFVELEISDQGTGFQVERINHSSFHTGSGLSGMRDRVSLWSGTFSVRSQPGEGTTLHVKVPLKKFLQKRKAKSG